MILKDIGISHTVIPLLNEFFKSFLTSWPLFEVSTIGTGFPVIQ